MLDPSIVDAVDDLDFAQCRELSALVRKRAGSLARKPPAGTAKRCRSSSTASVRCRGSLYTGEILEVHGKCVVLKFTDSDSVLVPMYMLCQEGFDLPETKAPLQQIVEDRVADCTTIEESDLPVLCGGALYMPFRVGEEVTEACRLVMSAVPTFLPTKAVVKLTTSSEGAAPDRGIAWF